MHSLSPTEPVPRGEGLAAVIEYLKVELETEPNVREALECLAEMTKEDGSVIDKNGKILIAKAMRDWIDVVEIQISGCNILNNLIVSGEYGSGFWSG